MAKKNTQAQNGSKTRASARQKRTCQEIAGDLFYMSGEVYGFYHGKDQFGGDMAIFDWSERLSSLAEELMSVEATT